MSPTSREPALSPAETAHELARLLIAIEQGLRTIDRWEGMPPEPERLASEVPFCHDTLEFTQWLQWIFVPRFRALIEGGGELPSACAIAPAAELAFADVEVDVAHLLSLIERFDRVLTTRRLPA